MEAVADVGGEAARGARCGAAGVDVPRRRPRWGATCRGRSRRGRWRPRGCRSPRRCGRAARKVQHRGRASFPDAKKKQRDAAIHAMMTGSAPLAQLDRVSGFEPEGRRFESCGARHSTLIDEDGETRDRRSREAGEHRGVERVHLGRGQPQAELGAAPRDVGGRAGPFAPHEVVELGLGQGRGRGRTLRSRRPGWRGPSCRSGGRAGARGRGRAAACAGSSRRRARRSRRDHSSCPRPSSRTSPSVRSGQTKMRRS